MQQQAYNHTPQQQQINVPPHPHSYSAIAGQNIFSGHKGCNGSSAALIKNSDGSTSTTPTTSGMRVNYAGLVSSVLHDVNQASQFSSRYGNCNHEPQQMGHNRNHRDRCSSGECVQYASAPLDKGAPAIVQAPPFNYPHAADPQHLVQTAPPMPNTPPHRQSAIEPFRMLSYAQISSDEQGSSPSCATNSVHRTRSSAIYDSVHSASKQSSLMATNVPVAGVPQPQHCPNECEKSYGKDVTTSTRTLIPSDQHFNIAAKGSNTVGSSSNSKSKKQSNTTNTIHLKNKTGEIDTSEGRSPEQSVQYITASPTQIPQMLLPPQQHSGVTPSIVPAQATIPRIGVGILPAAKLQTMTHTVPNPYQIVQPQGGESSGGGDESSRPAGGCDSEGPGRTWHGTRHRLVQRRKQILFGKVTFGYRNYALTIPCFCREPGNPRHPVTPRFDASYSKRKWDGLVGEWRRALHEWDAGPTPTDLAVTERVIAEGREVIEECHQDIPSPTGDSGMPSSSLDEGRYQLSDSPVVAIVTAERVAAYRSEVARELDELKQGVESVYPSSAPNNNVVGNLCDEIGEGSPNDPCFGLKSKSPCREEEKVLPSPNAQDLGQISCSNSILLSQQQQLSHDSAQQMMSTKDSQNDPTTQQQQDEAPCLHDHQSSQANNQISTNEKSDCVINDHAENEAIPVASIAAAAQTLPMSLAKLDRVTKKQRQIVTKEQRYALRKRGVPTAAARTSSCSSSGAVAAGSRANILSFPQHRHQQQQHIRGPIAIIGQYLSPYQPSSGYSSGNPPAQHPTVPVPGGAATIGFGASAVGGKKFSRSGDAARSKAVHRNMQNEPIVFANSSPITANNTNNAQHQIDHQPNCWGLPAPSSQGIAITTNTSRYDNNVPMHQNQQTMVPGKSPTTPTLVVPMLLPEPQHNHHRRSGSRTTNTASGADNSPPHHPIHAEAVSQQWQFSRNRTAYTTSGTDISPPLNPFQAPLPQPHMHFAPRHHHLLAAAVERHQQQQRADVHGASLVSSNVSHNNNNNAVVMNGATGQKQDAPFQKDSDSGQQSMQNNKAHIDESSRLVSTDVLHQQQRQHQIDPPTVTGNVSPQAVPTPHTAPQQAVILVSPMSSPNLSASRTDERRLDIKNRRIPVLPLPSPLLQASVAPQISVLDDLHSAASHTPRSGSSLHGKMVQAIDAADEDNDTETERRVAELIAAATAQTAMSTPDEVQKYAKQSTAVGLRSV